MNILAGEKAQLHIVTINFTTCLPRDTAIEAALFFSVITTGQGYGPDPWPFRFSQASQSRSGGRGGSEGARILSAAFFPNCVLLWTTQIQALMHLWPSGVGEGVAVQLPATLCSSVCQREPGAVTVCRLAFISATLQQYLDYSHYCNQHFSLYMCICVSHQEHRAACCSITLL